MSYAERQTDRQADRQTSRHTDRNTLHVVFTPLVCVYRQPTNRR